MSEIKNEYIDKIFDLAKLSLAFAKVNRATLHEDGIRPESDTDHSFMLGLISCSLADTFYKDKLDIGLISQFALIHDIVEVYAGDTNSFINTSLESKKIKEENELKAFEKIKEDFNNIYPWVSNTIEKYESQKIKEAIFVKFVDKIMPELTHILSDFAYIKSTGLGKEYFFNHHNNKLEKFRDLYYSDFPEVFEVYNNIWEKTLNKYKELV